MYLQKGTKYQGVEYAEANEEEQLYRGTVVFVIVGLKYSIPFGIQVLLEISINGELLAKEIEDNIKRLVDTNFIVRGIVRDNDSRNASAFTKQIWK